MNIHLGSVAATPPPSPPTAWRRLNFRAGDSPSIRRPRDDAEPFCWMSQGCKKIVMQHYKPNRIFPLSADDEVALKATLSELSHCWSLAFPTVKLPDDTPLQESEHLAQAFLRAVLKHQGSLDATITTGQFREDWVDELVDEVCGSFQIHIHRWKLCQEFVERTIDDFFDSLWDFQEINLRQSAYRERRRVEDIRVEPPTVAGVVATDRFRETGCECGAATMVRILKEEVVELRRRNDEMIDDQRKEDDLRRADDKRAYDLRRADDKRADELRAADRARTLSMFQMMATLIASQRQPNWVTRYTSLRKE